MLVYTHQRKPRVQPHKHTYTKSNTRTNTASGRLSSTRHRRVGGATATPRYVAACGAFHNLLLFPSFFLFAVVALFRRVARHAHAERPQRGTHSLSASQHRRHANDEVARVRWHTAVPHHDTVAPHDGAPTHTPGPKGEKMKSGGNTQKNALEETGRQVQVSVVFVHGEKETATNEHEHIRRQAITHKTWHINTRTESDAARRTH